MTQQYSRCPLSFKLRYVDDLQSIKRTSTLWQGSQIHGGNQEYFIWLRDTGDKNQALSAANDFFVVEAKKIEQDTTLFEEEKLELLDMTEESRSIVMNYLMGDNIPDDWEILHVEEEFIVLLDSGQTVTFTPDLVIQDGNGDVYCVDHKSTSDSVPDELPTADLQVLMYSAGLREMYPNFAGFIFNYLRKKLPTQPRLNTTKPKTQDWYAVNNLKSIDTTYEILRDFLVKNAPELLDEDSHKRRLGELYGKNKFFWRQQVPMTPAALDNALNEVRMKLNQINSSMEAGEWPRNLVNSGHSTCDRCEFQVLCTTDLLGRNTELIINEYYEPREHKNPYEEA
jgi:hypothetical protein